MTVSHILYFMSLVGALAGLLSWGLTTLVSLVTDSSRLLDISGACLLGALIGGLAVGFSDHWSGSRVLARWVLAGVGIGLTAGFVGSLLQILVENVLMEHYPLLARVLAWMLLGALIGLGLGLYWARVNPVRIFNGFTGGLLGGLAGGLLFSTAGAFAPEFTQALGFMLTGLGVCLGVSIAPVVVTEGLLQFVSSGDGRAQTKYGRVPKKQWQLIDGSVYVLGSQSRPRTQAGPASQPYFYIPDASIAERHATLLAKDGRYYLERHKDIRDGAGQARYVLSVRGTQVSATRELRENDDILVGRTALRFLLKQKTN